MGSEYSKVNSILSEGMKTGQWALRNEMGITIFTNTFTGQEFELKHFKTTQEQVGRYNQRQKYSYGLSPKIILLAPDSSECHLLVQHAPYKIQTLLQNRITTDLQLLIELGSVLEALERLTKRYSCFYISESMIRANKKNKIVLWFNQEFHKNDVQFPIPNGQGESTMVTKVMKIYNKHLTYEFKINIQSNFKETLAKVAQLTEKARKNLTSGSSRISLQNSAHNNSTASYIPTRQCTQLPPPRHLQKQVSQQKTLPYSRSHYQSLQYEPQPLPSYNSCQTRYPISKSRSNSKVQFHNFGPNPEIQTKNSIYQVQTARTYNMTERGKGMMKKNSNYDSTAPPCISHIYNTKKSSFSGYIQNPIVSQRRKNQFASGYAQKPVNGLRRTNQSHSSYESVSYPGHSFLKLHAVQSKLRNTLLQTEYQVRPFSIENHLTELGSTPIAPRQETSVEYSLRRANSYESNQKGGTQRLIEDANPSEFSISKTNLEMENQLNGLFAGGSAKSIEECSELGSPMRRQLKSDLQSLFI